MTDERDPEIERWFAESQHELDATAFTAAVMDRTRFLKVRRAAPWVAVGLVLAITAWVLAVPLATAELVARVLTTTVLDLGDGWLAWFLSPVNSVAALVALAVKLIRMLRRRIVNASTVSWTG